jgi:hypothetical protein
MKTRWLAAIAVLCCGALQPAHSATLTYPDLVHRLSDMEALSVLPLPGEKGALASSYDRASRYDETTKKYLNWDANGDNSGIIRREGDSEVLADINGPGCIWRVWAATPEAGHIKMYLDGALVPAVDLPFKGFFDHTNAPFTYPALVHQTTANGFNSYVPISFGKSCKIVADKGWGSYYQFSYTSFPAGTIVPTFSRDMSAANQAALAAADRALSIELGNETAPRAGEKIVAKMLTIPAGGRGTLADLKGPRALSSLRFKLDAAALAGSASALREAVLSIRWDDEKSPSVWVPLGDFFGSAPGFNLYKSLPLGMTADGFYSHWYMPFRRAHIEILNEGSQPLRLLATLKHAPLMRPLSQLGRFHAKWHRDFQLPDPATGRAIDWPLLQTQGRGRFCGVMLHVWNPKGGWWGEGDEKFFVDGEKFPSTFGTGSEDYFGYAWSSFKRFNHALHNQPNVDLRSGNLSVNRWHIADNVPFQQSFEGDIEKYFPNSRPTLFASTTYWYLAPGGIDPYGATPLAQRTGYYSPLQPARIAGALEGEELRVVEKTGGEVGVQDMSGFEGTWSGYSQTWWTDARPGDRLTFALDAPAAGRFNLKAQFTKARDYGMAQFYLDGQKLGAPLDFYHDGVVASGELSLGTVELTRGEHRFTVEITGANKQAEKRYLIGLDYLKLETAR